MVRIYYTDDNNLEDPRLPRLAFPPKQLPLNRLLKKTGVIYNKVDVIDLAEYRKRIDLLRTDRKYETVDDWTLRGGLTDYDEKLKKWFEPHIHNEDETRLVMEGNAYYDILEPKTNKWLRLALEQGDLLIIPPGCVHRFSPDLKNYVKFRRFFSTTDINPACITNTEAEEHPARIKYLAMFETASPVTPTSPKTFSNGHPQQQQTIC